MSFLLFPSSLLIPTKHYSAFSPNPYFIVAFFILQFIAQFFFVRGLFAVTATPNEPTLLERFFRFIRLTPASSKANLVDSIQTYYSMSLALGNLLHGKITPSSPHILTRRTTVAWTVFWMHEWFWAALPMVAINTLIQFYVGVLMLEPYDSSEYNGPVHVISKLGAGVGYLGILDTTATAAVRPTLSRASIIFAQGIVRDMLAPLQQPYRSSSFSSSSNWYVTYHMSNFSHLKAIFQGAIYDPIAFWNCAILFDALALCAGQPSWSHSLALAAAFIVLEIYIVYFSPCAGEPW